MFNLFRLAGDFVHCVSIYLLIHKIHTSRSVSGISFKTQALYALVYITRYLDILWGAWFPIYNLFMKILYISTSVYILHLMKDKYRPTFNPNIDTFKIEYLLGGSVVMAFITTPAYIPSEILWAFSIWLESVAILPQLFLLQRTGEAEALTVHYIFALGAYRFLYVFNWIYKWVSHTNFDYLALVAGIIQTVLYSDFFYIYYTKVMKGQKFELPQ
ncbi:ER lumen protein-retaining receptor [Trichomonascus vanleenenianus]|uniref:Erd2p n=1 Tax=Trichomonascus vanleenenianus TaxID=2268995 RepID=UPI003ECAD0EA